MKPGKKFYKRPTVIAIATICLLAAVVVPTTIALTERTEKVDETSSESDVEGEKKKTTFSIYGNVTDHNGAAANGAQIAIITSKLGVKLTDGKLVPQRHIDAENAKIITTDSTGQFYLPDMPDEKFTLVAAHNKGFAQIKSDDLPIPASIRLKPWGRIEGKLAANREAVEGKIGLWRFPNITWHEHKFVCDYESRCNDKGNFVFEKVPAGWFEAGYLIYTNKGNSPSFSFTSRTPVEVTPAQTAKLTLGNEGLPVIGKFVPPKGYRKKIPFVAGLRALVTARPKVPYPDNYTQMSKEQQNRWHKNWLKSPDSKAYRSKSWFNNNWRHYTFIINDDGTFRIEDVITGKYGLTVYIEKEIFNSDLRPQDIAYFADVIEVPQIPGRRSDVPLDLGTLELKLPDTKSTGQVEGGGVWGSAVQGVQCRVRAEKPIWPQGTVPKLFADLRNRGKRNLPIALEHESWEIEIDGKWHITNTSRSGLRRYLPLGPGQQQQDLEVWIHANDSISRNLRALEPGKHTLRVARLINYDTRPREDMLRVVSNPVEIEILSESDDRQDERVVKFEMRIMLADKDFIERIAVDGEGEKKPEFSGESILPAETEAVFISGAADELETTDLWVKGVFLDDSDVQLLVRALQEEDSASMLTAPKITVVENEQAIVRIGQEISYVAGFQEEDSADKELVPIMDTLETGVEITVECQIDDEKKVLMLDLIASMSDTTGFQKRRYKKGYWYQVPKLQKYEVKSADIPVPQGKTLLVHGPFPKGATKPFKSGKRPEYILILVKPVIAPEKGADSGSGVF